MLLQTQAETAEVVQPGEHSKEILEPCQCLDRDYKKERDFLYRQIVTEQGQWFYTQSGVV